MSCTRRPSTSIGLLDMVRRGSERCASIAAMTNSISSTRPPIHCASLKYAPTVGTTSIPQNPNYRENPYGISIVGRK